MVGAQSVTDEDNGIISY